MGTLLQVQLQGRLGPSQQLLDLGSGHGSAAHANIRRFGCKVTGFNLGALQNKLAEEEATRLGIQDNFDTRQGDFDADGLPEEWTQRFDGVWSEEVICHSKNKPALLKEINRVLKPGAALCFSDIMAGEDATADELRSFTDRNATVVMYRPSDYLADLQEADFGAVGFMDFSEHLPAFLKGMVQRIDDKLDEMVAKGVDKDYALNFRQSLSDRVGAVEEGRFVWGAFTATKKQDPAPSPFLRLQQNRRAAAAGSGISSHGITGRTFSTMVDRSGRASRSGGGTGSESRSEATASAKDSVVIVGAGHVGTYLAVSSARNNLDRDVILKTRPESSNQDVAENIYEKHGVQIVGELPKDLSVDVAFITTKTHSLRQAAADLASSLGAEQDGPPVVGMVHNGFAHVPESLEHCARPVSCVTRGGYACKAHPDGSIDMEVKNGHEPWLIEPVPEGQRIVKFLEAAGVPVKSEEDFYYQKLSKFLVNCTGNLLAVARNCDCANLVGRHEKEMVELFDELYDVLQADGAMKNAWAFAPGRAELRDATIEAIASYGSHLPSTKMDFDSNRELEIDSLNGYILSVAAANELDAPVNRGLVAEVLALVEARGNVHQVQRMLQSLRA
eukprot:scaffold91_cov254-Pinguiococcus_pyrenoidosus.AAC.44